MNKKSTGYAEPKSNPKILSAIVILVLLLLVVWTLSDGRSPTNIEATPQATSTSYSVEALIATAEAVEATLPTPTLLPGWPEDKAKDIAARDLSETAYATARVLYPPPPNYRPPRTPIPTRIWPTPIPHDTPTGDGIIRDMQSNGPPCIMLYSTNEWSGQINGQQGEYYTLACAGSDKQDKTLGAIVVRVGSHDPDQPSEVTYFRTTAHTGQLRIIREANNTLTLQASDNSLLNFDLATRQWVNPPLTPSPSVSPLPTLTASP
jgi:hypothetical protein